MKFDTSQFVITHEVPETETYDIMKGDSRQGIDVDGQSGFVALVDCMPRICPVGKTADFAIVQAARVSYADGTKTVSEDDGLVRYLFRNQHTTPVEMCIFKFHMRMPLFVARQIIRHRMSSVNEESARYSVMKDLRWLPRPDEVRAVSNKNKQVSEGLVDPDTAGAFCNYVETFGEDTYTQYQEFVAKGVGRELARVALPLNMYTSWYWKMDLHNLFHFLGLRMHEHAQKETRDYANAMYALIQPIVPVACQAFLDYHHHMGGLKLSALEVEAIASGELQFGETESLGNPTVAFLVGQLKTDNKREKEEFAAKLRRLNLRQ